LIGQRFNRLTVVSRTANSGKKDRYECSCDCGGSTMALGWSLRAGRSRSCGCLRAEELNARQGNENHKHYGTLEYSDWLAMKSRCYYPKNRAYKKYGGTGIKVCERWRDSFSAFLTDLGPLPSLNHRLGRIDEAGDFTPENCQWVRGPLRKVAAPRIGNDADSMPSSEAGSTD
jgi:hypothetical protein